MSQNDTVCQNCTFAVYEGNTQTDCSAGQLDLFREKGVPVVEAYNEQGEFYVVQGKICHYYRDTAWAEQNKSVNDLVALARLENTTRVDVLIYIDNEDIPDSAIESAIQSCDEQTVKVNCVLLLLNNLGPARYANLLKLFLGKFAWQIEQIKEKSSENNCVNAAVAHCKGNFYVVINAGDDFLLPNYFVEKIDNYINKEMNTLAMLVPSFGTSGLTVNRKVHNDYGGNSSLSIREKIELLVKEQDVPHLIKKWEDLYG